MYSRIITAAIKGTMNQKHQRQEACCVTAPPMRGPKPFPRATVAPIKPLYFPRCSSVVMSLEIIITRAFLGI